MCHNRSFVLVILFKKGMGDTRGVVIDKENIQNTINYLKEFDHLNAICFLVKPNQSKLHASFRYCFRELLVHLPKRSVENICFCFTNTRGKQVSFKKSSK
jgi:hypothetical protein